MDESTRENLALAGFVACLAFLCFVAGSLVTQAGVWPAGLLRRTYFGARTVLEAAAAGGQPLNPMLWWEARHAHRGVTRHDPARAYDGLTLYTSGDGPRAVLVDMAGEVVHEWSRPFAEAWPAPPHVDDPNPEDQIHWRDVHLFPNGDVLVVYVGMNDFPWGYGVARLTRDSEVVWTYPGRAHHDLHVLPDGRVAALLHGVRDEAHPAFPNLTAPYLEDSLVLLSPEGEELSRWSILEAFVDSPAQTLVRHHSINARGDLFNANAVASLTPDLAARWPFAEADDLMLSLRELHALVLLRPRTGKVVWVLRGPWRKQHDPDPLPDGRILLFDNLGDWGPRGESQVLEVDPLTAAIPWRYGGTAEDPLYTQVRGSQERLPNGNTLITESGNGRILEVTRGGDIVWEYHNPVRAGEEDAMVAMVNVAQRFRREDLPFLDPGQP